jgi:hypothetical protein
MPSADEKPARPRRYDQMGDPDWRRGAQAQSFGEARAGWQGKSLAVRPAYVVGLLKFSANSQVAPASRFSQNANDFNGQSEIRLALEGDGTSGPMGVKNITRWRALGHRSGSPHPDPQHLYR